MPRILSAAEARRLRSHLKRGGLVAYPTESRAVKVTASIEEGL